MISSEEKPLLTEITFEQERPSSLSTLYSSINNQGSDQEAQKVEKVSTSSSKKLISHQLLHYNESYMAEVLDTITLAVPIFFSSISWVGMKTTDTALLGHISSEALSAAALSDLYTMCTGVLVQGKILGIFIGQAVGAGNKLLAGIYLQVSLLVLGVLSIPVIVSWLLTGEVWKLLGEPEYLYRDANYYASILAIAIPGMVVTSQLSQFFSAQRIMHPEVNASLIGLLANLLFGVIFVFGVGIDGFDGYGFAACPIVTVSVVYVQLIFMWTIYCHRQGLHKDAWKGFSLKEITKHRIVTYAELYFPAALSMASDFWRMSVIGGIAAKLGDDEVAVFNAGYRIFWLSLMLSGAIGGASGIKIGLSFGSGDAVGAKRAAGVGVAVAFGVLIVVALLLAIHMEPIARIFTNDHQLVLMFQEAKWPFILALFFMNLAVVIERIPMSKYLCYPCCCAHLFYRVINPIVGMGRTADIFRIGFVSSWLGELMH